MIFKRKPRQTCFVYCDCGHELIKTANRTNMSYEYDRGVATYDCPNCGIVTAWDFIHYPVPIRVERV